MPCNIIISRVLLFHFFTLNNHMPRSFYFVSMLSSYAKMFYCFVYRSNCGGPCWYIWGSDVQVKNCVFIHKLRQMLWWWTFFFWEWKFFWGIYWSRYIGRWFIQVIFQRWDLCSVKKKGMKTDTIWWRK